jgi:hypothetical protein
LSLLDEAKRTPLPEDNEEDAHVDSESVKELYVASNCMGSYHTSLASQGTEASIDSWETTGFEEESNETKCAEPLSLLDEAKRTPLPEDNEEEPESDVEIVKELYVTSNSMVEVVLLASDVASLASKETEPAESESNSLEMPAPLSATTLSLLEETKGTWLSAEDAQVNMGCSFESDGISVHVPPLADQPSFDRVDFESVKRLYAAGMEVMNQIAHMKHTKKLRSKKGKAATKKTFNPYKSSSGKTVTKPKPFPEMSTRFPKSSPLCDVTALACDPENRSEQQEDSRDQTSDDCSRCQSSSPSNGTASPRSVVPQTKVKRNKPKPEKIIYPGIEEPESIDVREEPEIIDVVEPQLSEEESFF